MSAPYTIIAGDCAGPYSEETAATLRLAVECYAARKREHSGAYVKILGDGADDEHDGLSDDEHEELDNLLGEVGL